MYKLTHTGRASRKHVDVWLSSGKFKQFYGQFRQFSVLEDVAPIQTGGVVKP